MILFVYALVEGIDFSSYYVFYGSLFFALFYVSAFRWGFDRISGALLRAAGYHRRAVLVGRGQHIDAVAEALKGSEVKPIGFVVARAARGERAEGHGAAGAARAPLRPTSTRC